MFKDYYKGLIQTLKEKQEISYSGILLYDISVEVDIYNFLQNGYMSFCENNLRQSKNTLKSVENVLTNFDASVLTRTKAEAYVQKMLEQGLSTATVAKKVSILKNFFEWQIENRYFESKNPFSGRLTPKVENQSHKAVSSDLIEKIVDETEADYLLVIVGLGAYAGLRISEILQLDETTFFGDYVEVLGKGNKTRFVSLALLPQKCLQAVKNVAFTGGFKGQRGRLSLSGLNKLVKPFLDKYGITSHCLRASFATNSLAQGIDVNTVRTMLGHTSLETTSIYIKNSTVDKQKEALQRVS
jgi:site-specific recombinase XerD